MINDLYIFFTIEVNGLFEIDVTDLNTNLGNTVYAIYFASLIFRESGLQDIFASG